MGQKIKKSCLALELIQIIFLTPLADVYVCFKQNIDI